MPEGPWQPLPKQRWRAFTGMSTSRSRPASIHAVTESSRHLGASNLLLPSRQKTKERRLSVLPTPRLTTPTPPQPPQPPPMQARTPRPPPSCPTSPNAPRPPKVCRRRGDRQSALRPCAVMEAPPILISPHCRSQSRCMVPAYKAREGCIVARCPGVGGACCN